MHKLTALTLAFAACVATAAADWCSVSLDQWTEGRTLEVIEGQQSPFGTWVERNGRLVAEGKARCWSTKLAPGDQEANTRVVVEFTVQSSSGEARDLYPPVAYAAACRWGFYWGENSPGWDVGVVMRWEDPLHFYRVQLSAHRGELALWDSTGGFLQLVSCPIKEGKRHTLEITARGAHFRVELDGQRVMDYWDQTLPHPAGQIGLAVYQSKVLFDRFDVIGLKAEEEPMPPHEPLFRMKQEGDKLLLFDGHEPISQFYKSTSGNEGALNQQFVKLKPGWRPAYYTWIGPGITPGPTHGVLRLVGELPEAFRIKRTGRTLEFSFRTERRDTARADYVCTVGYDARRGVYRYEYRSHVRFMFKGEYQLNAFELIDPLTYNNREPGPEVVHRWNWTGHRWHVFVAPDKSWARYPLIDYLDGYSGQETYWGRFSSFLYPDAAACPAFEVELGWKPLPGRHFELGLCHWGYDFHHTERGPTLPVPAGSSRDFTLRLTAMPLAEAEAIFKKSRVADKVAKSPDRFPNFDPTGNTFAGFSTRQEPTSTMVWESGDADEHVGRTDSRSLRIGGPGNAAVRIYQYVVEQNAERWWIRGWFKSSGVSGRGLQMRVKYAYNPKPEEAFYLGGQGDRDWTYFSFISDVLKRRDCTDISFELDGGGTVWIDDVAVSALREGQRPDTTRFPMPSGLEPRADMVIDLPMTSRPAGRGVCDASYNGHHLLLFGSPRWAQEQGRGFLRFDGVDDRGTIPLKPTLMPLDYKTPMGSIKTLFPLKAFTYEIWARPQVPVGGPNARVTLFHFRFNPIVQFDTFRTSDGTCRLSYQNDRRRPSDRWKAGEQLRIHARVPYGRWLHIVATHGDGEVVLYVNGKSVGRATYDQNGPGFEFFAYTAQYNVGCWYGKNQFYHGDMGPFRLYTRALSAEEVAERYQSGWPASR